MLTDEDMQEYDRESDLIAIDKRLREQADTEVADDLLRQQIECTHKSQSEEIDKTGIRWNVCDECGIWWRSLP